MDRFSGTAQSCRNVCYNAWSAETKSGTDWLICAASILLGPFYACSYGPCCIFYGLYLLPRYRAKLQRLDTHGLSTIANVVGLEATGDAEKRRILSYIYEVKEKDGSVSVYQNTIITATQPFDKANLLLEKDEEFDTKYLLDEPAFGLPTVCIQPKLAGWRNSPVIFCIIGLLLSALTVYYFELVLGLWTTPWYISVALVLFCALVECAEHASKLSTENLALKRYNEPAADSQYAPPSHIFIS